MSSQSDSNVESTNSSVLVFPGMAPAAFATLGRFLVLDPFARKRLAEADDALGYRLFDRYYEVSDDYSEYAQIAFMVSSVALADRAVADYGIAPAYCAAPSFGQKAALAYTGALSFGDSVRLTAELASCEQRYFAEYHRDVVTHAFVRTPKDKLAQVLEDLGTRGNWYEYSGYLDDDFFMVSLSESVLDEFKRALTAMGAYSMYTMEPPVHAPAFRGLRDLAEETVFADYEIGAPSVPMISDVDGSLVETAEQLRTLLLDTFDCPIRWPAMVDTMVALGARTAYFAGPENVFSRVRYGRKRLDVVSVDQTYALKEILRVPA